MQTVHPLVQQATEDVKHKRISMPQYERSLCYCLPSTTSLHRRRRCAWKSMDPFRITRMITFDSSSDSSRTNANDRPCHCQSCNAIRHDDPSIDHDSRGRRLNLSHQNLVLASIRRDTQATERKIDTIQDRIEATHVKLRGIETLLGIMQASLDRLTIPHRPDTGRHGGRQGGGGRTPAGSRGAAIIHAHGSRATPGR